MESTVSVSLVAPEAEREMGGHVHIKTFGCQMNQQDSLQLEALLERDLGLQSTTDAQKADVLILNTCAVREKAEDKVYSDLGRLREMKKNKPHLLIGVGGCVATQNGADIIRRSPWVDLVFGPQTLHRLPAMIEERRRTGKAQIDLAFPEIEKFDHLPPAHVDGPTAFVSIMEGCSKYCSFCVVPYTRGPEVSRPLQDILREVAGLVAKGVSEVMLLGQNVNAYRGRMGGEECIPLRSDLNGRETILDSTAPMADFALLLEYIAGIPGVRRIRYTTSHPREMTQALIDCHLQLPALAGHIHLPVQSGSDRILAAMKRGYMALEYKSIIRRLRLARPDISITSDFIVGFPGETEQDFQATLNLVKETGLDSGYSFVYSPRPGTPAVDYPDPVSHQEKMERLHRLQSLLDEQEQSFNARMLGSVQTVLVQGLSSRDPADFTGRADNYRVINFPAVSGLSIGDYCSVLATEVLAHSLRGEVVLSTGAGFYTEDHRVRGDTILGNITDG